MTGPTNLARYPEPVEFSVSLLGRLALLGLGLVMSAASAAVALWPPTHGRFAGIGWIGWLGLLLFGGGSLYFGYRLVRPRVAVRLDAEGLLDASGPASVGRVGWDEVVRASVVRVGLNSMIGVEVRDPDGVLARIHPVKRAVAAANRGLADTPVWINALGLPADDIAALITSYREQWARAQRAPRSPVAEG